jgi:hypothetical protein
MGALGLETSGRRTDSVTSWAPACHSSLFRMPLKYITKLPRAAHEAGKSVSTCACFILANASP